MSDPEFDFNVLKDVTGDDPAFERELLEEYLDTSAGLLERQREHLEGGDANSLQRAAHSLKGSSLTLGAIRLGQLAKEIEESARQDQLPRAAASLENALQEFAALRPLLEQHIRRLAA